LRHCSHIAGAFQSYHTSDGGVVLSGVTLTGGKASEALLALKPVTFRYKEELDPEGILQFGLVAEDVERIG
jgi:hypothetical protein